MRFFELGWSGRLETSSFQGLSAGNTWRALRMRSASGVSNITGCLTGGNGRPPEWTRDSPAAMTAATASAAWYPSAVHFRMAHSPEFRHLENAAAGRRAPRGPFGDEYGWVGRGCQASAGASLAG